MSEETTPPQIPAFSPEDLVQAILLIDEGVNQGAYKGWETVQRAIAVRARLLMFAQHWQGTIDAANPPAEEANPSPDSEGVHPGETIVPEATASEAGE